MARTITEIKKEITDAFVSNATIVSLYELTPGQDFESQFSKVSVESILFYVMAVAIWALENVLDISMQQQTQFINQIKIHSTTWYSLYAKKFQFGDSLPWGEVEYDNTGVDPQDVATAQVVKFAAVTQTPGGLMVKVAGLTNDELAPITPAQFTAFQDYMFRVSAAGDNLFYRNEDPDSLKLTLKIIYDALVLDSTGKRLDGTNDTPVADAIDTYIKGIDFNGRLIEQDLVDALQKVEGVKIADVELIQTQYGSMAFADVPAEGVVPFAGYVRVNNPADLVINYEAV